MELSIATNLVSGRLIKLDPEALKKHTIVLGSSGSGKTVLCKKIIEECALNKIPSIIIDTQGDLSSLALSKSKEFNEKVKVKIYTPASTKGIPLCLNPFNFPKAQLNYEETVSIINTMASSIIQLCDYNIDSSRGKSAQAFLYEVLRHLYKNQIHIRSFNELIQEIEKTSFNQTFFSGSEILELKKRLKYLTIGKNDLLFNLGERLDIKTIINNSEISVLCLNSLDTINEKDFFISVIANNIYNYMLDNPSQQLKFVFFIDEISSFLPPTKNTLSKSILKLIFKQARKYGIGCIASTQNPGDIDYKVLAQFSNWFIGRITTQQDLEKLKLAFNKKLTILNSLPQLKTSEFIYFSYENLDDVKKIKVGQLLTEHQTFSLDDIEKFIPKKQRKIDIVKEDSLSLKCFKPNTSLNIQKLIEKNKKKNWLFQKKEQASQINFHFIPYYSVLIRQAKKGFFETKFLDYLVFFNAMVPEIVVFSGNKIKKSFSIEKLINLSKKELDTIKLLIENDEKIATAEIALKLGIESSSILQSLNHLKEMHLVSFKKLGKNFLWYNLINVDIPMALKKLESKNAAVVAEKIDISYKPMLQKDEIEQFIKNFFDADAISSEIIYFPVYKIEYTSDSGKREIKLSGTDGKVIL